MVHSFQLLGKNIALDVNSDALYDLDPVSWELVRAWDPDAAAADGRAFARIAGEYGEEEAREAASEIAELAASGGLFTPDDAMLQPPPEEERGYAFKSLCLHLAHDCNMRCAYCFASAGSYGLERGLMSFETARAAIDFAIRGSGARRNIEIDFFGGEPLLNYDVLRRTVEYARAAEDAAGKHFRFTLTTNGLLLDDGKIAYVNRNMDNLVLSLDGRPEVNDAVRKRLDGSGTYDALVSRFKKIIAGREGSWYVRGTYTAKNRDFERDVLHLADLGFNQLSVEPVVSPADPALEFDPADLDGLLSGYERLALAMYERERGGEPFHFFHFNVDLESGPCPARRVKGCGAGFEYAAVAPDGDIYPCHQFVGVDGFKLGSVYGGGLDETVSDRFKKISVFTNEDCRGCWAKFFCGGGCAANAWHYNRDTGKPNAFYCALFKKRIECALWLVCSRRGLLI